MNIVLVYVCPIFGLYFVLVKFLYQMNHPILILKIGTHCLSEHQIALEIWFFIRQAEVLTKF